MFENLIQGEDKPSATEVLNTLLDKKDRDSKTNVVMPNIQFMLENRRLALKKMFPNKSIIERDEMALDYYKELKPSLEGLSWEKIIEGIKEMKPQLMDAQLMENMKK